MKKKDTNNPKSVSIENNEKKSTTNNHPENSDEKTPDPTRYGDWEKGGRCIDF